jgi:hypothetical protein
MFAKFAVLIVGLALVAAGLLAARQVRTQCAHELAQARVRVMRLDQERWKLRAEIAGLITPANVSEMAARQSPLKPLAGEFPPPLLTDRR